MSFPTTRRGFRTLPVSRVRSHFVVGNPDLVVQIDWIEPPGCCRVFQHCSGQGLEPFSMFQDLDHGFIVVGRPPFHCVEGASYQPETVYGDGRPIRA